MDHFRINVLFVLVSFYYINCEYDFHTEILHSPLYFNLIAYRYAVVLMNLLYASIRLSQAFRDANSYDFLTHNFCIMFLYSHNYSQQLIHSHLNLEYIRFLMLHKSRTSSSNIGYKSFPDLRFPGYSIFYINFNSGNTFVIYQAAHINDRKLHLFASYLIKQFDSLYRMSISID